MKPKRTFDYWLGLEVEVQEPILLGLNVPLRSVAPIFEETMASRRSVQRQNIKDNQPVGRTGTSSAAPPEKRQKTTHDSQSQRTVEPQGFGKDKQVGLSATSGSAPLVNREDTTMETVIQKPFSPSLADVDGKLVLLDDCVRADPRGCCDSASRSCTA